MLASQIPLLLFLHLNSKLLAATVLEAQCVFFEQMDEGFLGGSFTLVGTH